MFRNKFHLRNWIGSFWLLFCFSFLLWQDQTLDVQSIGLRTTKEEEKIKYRQKKTCKCKLNKRYRLYFSSIYMNDFECVFYLLRIVFAYEKKMFWCVLVRACLSMCHILFRIYIQLIDSEIYELIKRHTEKKYNQLFFSDRRCAVQHEHSIDTVLNSEYPFAVCTWFICIYFHSKFCVYIADSFHR